MRFVRKFFILLAVLVGATLGPTFIYCGWQLHRDGDITQPDLRQIRGAEPLLQEVVANRQQYLYIACVLGGLLLLLTAVGVAALFRSDAPAPAGPQGKYDIWRGNQPPLSAHTGIPAKRRDKALGLLFTGVFPIGLGIGIPFVAKHGWEHGDNLLFYLAIALVVICPFWLVGTCVASWNWYRHFISDLALFPDGLQWRKGGQHFTAAWTDVCDVKRERTIFRVNGQEMGRSDVLTVKLVSGEELHFIDDEWTDYPVFADRIEHAWNIGARRLAEPVSTKGPVVRI